MSLEELIKLYILQKNSSSSSNLADQQLYEQEYHRLTQDLGIEIEEAIAEPVFAGQPRIPFILFKPKAATNDSPKPLIMHVHGGPNVYMSKDKMHAEIAYFLSRGYVVACPNYRGSTGSPFTGVERAAWDEWVKKAKDKHHIYGPEDVYAVTLHMLDEPYVNKENIILRGGSFGSLVNAELLAGVKKGKFKPFFKGAHFSGGVKYPPAAALPDDVSLLITHSLEDKIASYGDAQIFMEHLLRKELSNELKGNGARQIETFVSKTGDHHLIDPNLQLSDEGTTSYQDLVRYLQLATDFVDAICHGDHFQATDSYNQYKALMAKPPKESEQIAYRIVNQANLYRHVKRKSALLAAAPANQSPLPLPSTETSASYPYCPTTALLKIYLKDNYTGDIKADYSLFLRHYFKPKKWTGDEKSLADIGRRMLNDSSFFDQMVEMIKTEEAFLRDHPNHMVLYHAAKHNVLFAYCFINLWKKILQGDLAGKLPVIEEMRLFDFMAKSIERINIFLYKMRKQRGKDTVIFNNVEGFSLRAIACNPTAISNSHTAASCSMLWYYNAGADERFSPTEIITSLLKVLGIYSTQRVARYTQLFEKASNSLQDQPQALMQQIFVPYETAQQRSYMCQLWGEEFAKNSMDLDSPFTVRKMITNPELYEEDLRKNANSFTNFSNNNYNGYDDSSEDFRYAGLLQNRYLTEQDENVVVKSYYRSSSLHEEFVEMLNELIQEDYVDYLANQTELPPYVIPRASQVKDSIQDNLHFFGSGRKINSHVFYELQRELSRGHVESPCKEIYSGIIDLSREKKMKLQMRLRTEFKDGVSEKVFIYSLCRYLKGYTYYELIEEAARQTILNKELPEDIKKEARPYLQRKYDELLAAVNSFCNPDSVDKVEISSNRYHELRCTMLDCIMKYKRDYLKHELISTAKGGRQYYESDLWMHELEAATECILRHARFSKEQGNGHDIRDRRDMLY